MATIFVIHDPRDADFIVETLLKPLPSLGFDRWVRATEESDAALASLRASRAFIVVVSQASRQSDAVRRLATHALKAPQPTISVQLDRTEPEQVADGLGAVPAIDPGDEIPTVPMAMRIREGLPLLLPPVEPAADRAEQQGELIEWNEEIFSGYLQDAVTQYDFSRGQALVASLARHLRERPYPYPDQHARADLRTFRRKRQFLLMDRYADLVIAAGTQDLEVRRQRAQALIELGRMDDALPLLNRNAEEATPGEGEWFEAHGLLGRLHKQQYVNASPPERPADLLRRAIQEYRAVCDTYQEQLWHGANAATLLLRAHRDGFEWASPDDARTIAARVLEQFDAARAANTAAVWDFASRVEALVALGRFDEALVALDEYLTHPDINANPFEVGSTFRQFDEVVQIRTMEGGQEIYDRMLRAVDRSRAGGATSTPQQREDAAQPDRLPVLIHVADPAWTPNGELRGLSISSRMSTVMAAHASRDAIAALLEDPLVISIEESREADLDYECVDSMPFIRVADGYTDTIGGFSEKGGGVLIAVIDDGIDVLHEAFLDDQGKSRVLGIWDQRDKTGPPPQGFDYGRHHTDLEIDGYVKARSVPETLGRNVRGHGTHVASIAAGRKVGTFPGGVAPEARLLLVIARIDEDIGYSKAYVDALAFIDRFATARALPVVVNVSQGMNAGGHDGRSALEVAFDEFSGGGRKPGRAVVKSAGNERGQDRHAQIFLGTGEAASLRWARSDKSRTRFERLELWWDISDILRLRLGHPGGDAWSDWVSAASPDLAGTLGPGGDFNMQLTRLHVDNGDNQLRIEIGGTSGGVMSGTWTLEIEATRVQSGRHIHAWIERGGPNGSRFENWSHPEMTLTVPGTAESVITVGAVAASSAQLGDFSSFGPTRDGRKKPDLVAPGVKVMAACGGTDRDVRPDHGTSMAAPHVAGAVALALSRAVRSNRRPPSASQIRAALTRKTRNFNGHHDPGRGFGVLDVTAFLGAF